MRRVIANYEKDLFKIQESFAKDLANYQKRRFTFPLEPREISALQDFVDVIFPDMNNRIYQTDDPE